MRTVRGVHRLLLLRLLLLNPSADSRARKRAAADRAYRFVRLVPAAFDTRPPPSLQTGITDQHANERRRIVALAAQSTPAPHAASWPGLLLVAVLAAIPAVAALAIFGIIMSPDSPGYVAYAQQIIAGQVPSGAALLGESQSPISLFRTPGYPAVLAVLMLLSPGEWRLATVLLQITAQAALAAGVYACALRLGTGQRLAFAAALLPCIGFAVVVQIAVLTDALYTALMAGAVLLALQRRMLWAGLALAAAATLREATPVLAFFYLPLALTLPARRLHAAAALLLPPLAVAAGLMAWNAARIGQPVLTTSRQTVMVQAVLPPLKRGLPIYDGPSDFDRIARETVGTGEYGMIDTLHLRLFHEAHMAAPDMAAAATARYWSAWQRFPAAMLTATFNNLRREFFAMPFQPVDTVGALMVYAGWPRPVFDRLNLLWVALRGGSVSAGLFILLDVTTRLAGGALGLLAVASPLLLRWRRDVVAVWIVCAGFFAVYLPVHIETRYLVPVVPLACLLAALAWPGLVQLIAPVRARWRRAATPRARSTEG